MTFGEMETILSVGRLVASIATPTILAIFGYLLLRRVEQIKAGVTKHSDFQIKWADEFFNSCQYFLQILEKELALLNHNSGDRETIMQIIAYHQQAAELELRIRRFVVFAPKYGPDTTESAQQCISRLRNLFEAGGGDPEPVIQAMAEFNVVSKKAHAEMLSIRA